MVQNNGQHALEERLFDELLAQIESAPEIEREQWIAEGEAAAEARRVLAEKILQKWQRILPRAERERVVRNVVNRVVGLGPLEVLMRDPDITEIMVNSETDIFIEKKGELQPVDPSIRFRDPQHILDIIDRIVGRLGRRVDKASPYVDARLEDGSRVHAIIDPLSVRGPTLTIRRFPKEPFDVKRLLDEGTLSPNMQRFLQACVSARLNILISGGTGSGKTSTLNAMARLVPEKERLITIEDTAELQIKHRNLVSLEARPPNIEGKGQVTIRELVANALRMRPDRIIVGEVRRGEAFDMLQAMNTGHEGSLTTVHANSAEDAIRRLESMVLMAELKLDISVIRPLIFQAIDIVVQQSRLRNGSRKIVSISEIIKPEGEIKEIFAFQIEREDVHDVAGYFTARNYSPRCLDKLVRKGEILADEFFRAVA